MDFMNKSNLIKAGAATVAIMLATNLTAKSSKLVQGLAAITTTTIAIPLASKIG